MTTTASIEAKGDRVIITMPRKDVPSLVVALKRCPCKASKSNRTQDIRDRLCAGLEKVR